MNNTGTKQVSIMKQTAFWREKNGEYRACLKYSVPIFVEEIYKMKRLEVSGAVRPIYGSLGVKRLRSIYKLAVLLLLSLSVIYVFFYFSMPRNLLIRKSFVERLTKNILLIFIVILSPKQTQASCLFDK